jgi:methyltransferase (TIGR00027 family)
MRAMGVSLVVSFGLTAAVTVSAVEPGQPSKTSIWTATLRAIGAKNPDPELRNPDDFASKLLGPQERTILNDFPMDALDLDFQAALKRIPSPAMVTTLVARTRYIDATMDQALHQGARQIIILGAGFDSRAYRFTERLAGIPVFEVDYGPTQEYKKRRVIDALGTLPRNVRYVPMDFAKDDLVSQLQSAGYSPTARSFFVWEGVTRYIPESAVRSTLRFVARHSGVDSTIVFDYVLSTNGAINNPKTQFAQWGEPFVFGFPGDTARQLVQQEALEVVSDVADAQLLASYARHADGSTSLPWSATWPVQRYCVARVPVGRAR